MVGYLKTYFDTQGGDFSQLKSHHTNLYMKRDLTHNIYEM